MDWITFGSTTAGSILSAVLVAFLSPRFQHTSWKQQKLKETRLAVANRISELLHNLYPLLLTRNTIPPSDSAEHGKFEFTAAKEMDTLLGICCVIFDFDQTLKYGTLFQEEINEQVFQQRPRSFDAINKAAQLFFVCAYGEAFGISRKEMLTRIGKHIDS